MTRIMNVMILAAMLALGMASGAYAEKTKFTESFESNTPGATDRFDLVCSESGKISVSVKESKGGHKDNIRGVEIGCFDNFTFDDDTANKGGAAVKASVNDCIHVDIAIFCDDSSPFCDDEYEATFSCKGNIEFLQQYQDDTNPV